MARIARTVALLLVCGGAPASAEIYRWTDARGQLHFTERLDRVPPEQREAARRGAAREEDDRLQTYAAPARPPAAQAASRGAPVEIPFRKAGTLMLVDAVVNDALSVLFLVDTGASGVSIPGSAAGRLGLRVDASTPRAAVRTAAGLVELPLVDLDSVQLGAVRVEGLAATVNPSLEVGLLGGTFFNNFRYGVDAAAGVITLTPSEAVRGGLGEEEWRARFRRLLDPLEQLEVYLAETELTRDARREELERKRAELRERLAALEQVARRAGVPVGWRR